MILPQLASCGQEAELHFSEDDANTRKRTLSAGPPRISQDKLEQRKVRHAGQGSLFRETVQTHIVANRALRLVTSI